MEELTQNEKDHVRHIQECIDRAKTVKRKYVTFIAQSYMCVWAKAYFEKLGYVVEPDGHEWFLKNNLAYEEYKISWE